MPNLPAPYVSPWREFGRNLRALAADVRLRLQELWRRNRDGDLPVPAFWPKDLSPYFWPLLLLFLLLLPLAGWRLLIAGTPEAPMSARTSAPAPELPEPNRIPTAPSETAAPSLPPAEPKPAPLLLETAAPIPLPTAPPPPQVPLDPLLKLLIDRGGSDHLLLAAEPDQARNHLLLRLHRSAWDALPRSSQHQQAEAWQRQSLDIGYDSLALVDADDRPLGRSARIGGGMILFMSEGAT